jgi:hypothetical protein
MFGLFKKKRLPFEESRAARFKAYAQYGQVDPDVLGPLVWSGPYWPAGKPLFRVLTRNGRTALATDGLSDPFDAQRWPTEVVGQQAASRGLGHELLIETEEVIQNDPADVIPGNALAQSWLYHLIFNVSFATLERNLLPLLAKFEMITVAVEPAPGLERFVGSNGFVGVLVGQGLDPQTIDLPSGRIVMVPIKLLSAAEYDWALSRGNTGGVELGQRFTAHVPEFLSSRARASVVERP